MFYVGTYLLPQSSQRQFEYSVPQSYHPLYGRDLSGGVWKIITQWAILISHRHNIALIGTFFSQYRGFF